MCKYFLALFITFHEDYWIWGTWIALLFEEIMHTLQKWRETLRAKVKVAENKQKSKRNKHTLDEKRTIGESLIDTVF